MEPFDIEKVRQHSPFMAWRLPKKTNALQGTRCYYPWQEATTEDTKHYRRMCEKLGIEKNMPLLMVLPKEALENLYSEAKGALGCYVSFVNAVLIRSDVYEKLVAGDPVSRHVVSHEMGHARKGSTRRSVLINGGAALVGLGTMYKTGDGMGTWSGMFTPDHKRTAAEDIKRIVTMPVAMTAGLYVGKVVQSYLTRFEEFAADDAARMLIGDDWQYRLGLAKHLNEVIAKREDVIEREIIAGFREVFEMRAKEGKLPTALKETGLSDDDLVEILLADLTATTFTKTFDLTDILLMDSYPTTGQRYQRILEEKGPADGLWPSALMDQP